MPSEADFKSDTVVGKNGETIGQICNKYFATGDCASAEEKTKKQDSKQQYTTSTK